MTQVSPASAKVLALLWGISGFATLVLETLWMRETALWAGNTVIASTLVIAVFFAAAAGGNAWGARIVAGVRSPLRFYGLFEIASALSAMLMLALSHWLWGTLSQAWLAAVVLVALPSFCSGVAFPSLAETFVPDARHRTSKGAPFYALNLAGASLGVVAGSVWLPLWLGISHAIIAAALLQLCGGILAWRLARNSANSLQRTTATPSKPNTAGWLLLGASGVLSLCAQSLLLVWVRQILEGSVYAVTAVLAVFIGGLGIGAMLAAALRCRGVAAVRVLMINSASSAMMLAILPYAGQALCTRELPLNGDSPTLLMLHALLDCSLLLPLTIALGGVFPVAWELIQPQTTSEGKILGRALALNKLGAATGSILGLFALLPALGIVRGTLAVAGCYGVISCISAWQIKDTLWRAVSVMLLLGVIGCIAQRPIATGITPELRVLASETGAYGPMTTVEDMRTGSRQILLNSRQRLSGTRNALASQQHQSWVPLLLCRNPQQVLTIGMAAGISAAAALDFPVQHVEAVELVPEVASAARTQFGEWNHALFTDPRAHIVIGDGRVALEQAKTKYDAIICDLLFPSEEGSALLYSRDFFTTAKQRLNRYGLFCVWLPCYQHTAKSAGVVIHTLLEVFPNAILVRANLDPLQPVIGLIGSAEPIPFGREFLASRLASAEVQKLAGRSPFLRSSNHAQLLFAGDLRSANPDFSAFEATTDDRPLFAFLGPQQPQGKERLYGFPFLDWTGKRFQSELHPSCDLGEANKAQLINATRAANFYFAAAVANTVLANDTRSDEKRASQVQGYLQRAHDLMPEAPLMIDDLGH